MLSARLDDGDDIYIYIYIYIWGLKIFCYCGWLLLSDSILIASNLILICWESSCLSKLQRKNKEGRRREKDIFQFQLYFIRDFCTPTLSQDYLRTVVSPKSGVEIC